ncbi:MAG: hypothetical protein K2J15_01320 [Muribaculaceae bacterium]|nr:hypothetical protein [Muribaculaceae bacterium]
MANEFTKYLLTGALLLSASMVSAEVIPAEKVLQLGTPISSEFTLRMSFGGAYGQAFGMAAVSLDSAKGVTLNENCPDKVQLYYGDELLAEVGATESDNNGITNIGFSYASDDDPLNFEGHSTWLIMFDASAPAEYKRLGDYTLILPEDLFRYGEDTVGSMTLHYTMVDKINASWGYTVTPENGSEFTVTNPIPSVTVTATGNARMLDYNNPVGGLYDPEGNLMKFRSSYPTRSGASLIWDFIDPYTSKVEWTEGEYTFKLPAHSLYVNMQGMNFGQGNFPSEDINVLYILRDGTTRVTVAGAEAAHSYTVYTTDGKLIAAGATGDLLLTLPEGIYIINGKKVKLTRHE